MDGFASCPQVYVFWPAVIVRRTARRPTTTACSDAIKFFGTQHTQLIDHFSLSRLYGIPPNCTSTQLLRRDLGSVIKISDVCDNMLSGATPVPRFSGQNERKNFNST
jgi:hypothetical protein